MERRRFLMAGLSLGGIAYTSGPPTSGTSPVVFRENGRPGWPLFEWRNPRGPLLTVYDDRTAYAGGTTRLKLPPVWIRTLWDQALTLLDAPAELVRTPATGGPYDQVRVRTPAGDYLTARLTGWQDGDPAHAYPPPARELYQQVLAMRRHILHAGTG